MKLKYKKLIVLVSLGTIFLSFIILSMVPTTGNTSDNPENAKLIKEGDKKITQTMKDYLKAKQDIDMDKLSELVSDITQVNEEKLRAKAAYIEDYQNIECHIIENEKQNGYRVYVQYDIKIANIDTLAPSLSAYYVKMTSDGSYLVYLSALDEEEDEFIQSADKNIEVKKLKEATAKKLNKALARDKVFMQFYKTLNQENTPSPSPQETKNP